ncbi:MAG: FAD-dependent oxidoreductase [Nannocystaceae bacterium]
MSSGPEAAPTKAARTDVLVLGASFAGIEVVLQLQRRLPRPLRITVVDRQEQHGYIPLVHERLCGRIPGPDTELPTARFVRSLPGAEFVCDEVVAFDPERKEVTLGSGKRIRARFVVVALGSVLAPPPSLPGGQHLGRAKLGAGVQGVQARLDAVLQQEPGSTPPVVVVVGGGISGVELAGELAALRRHRPDGWQAPAVTLVAGSARLLPELAEGVGRVATAALVEQGVELRLGTRVAEAEAEAVLLRRDAGTPERLPCALALWAGGIGPAPILAQLGLPRTDDGWLAVGPTLQCFATATPTRPDIFACGDAVRVVGGDGVWPTMQRAIECLWQAKVVARNLVTLAACPPRYPDGVPALRPHVLRPRFAYGVSLGQRSLVVYGRARLDLPAINTWFRRWLMRRYFARYAPRAGSDA